MGTRTVTDATFAAALPDDSTSFLYVWAPWCGPCRMVKPHYTAIADSGDAAYFDANLESFSATAERLGVKTTPTIIAFRDGQEVERRTGALMRSQLEAWVASVAQDKAV